MQFEISHSVASRVVKGEDFIVVKEIPKHKGFLYLLADGHSGQGCARFISSQLPAYLEDRLPALPSSPEEQGGRAYSDLLASIVCEAFVGLDDAWCRNEEACDTSGSALTVVLITGWLVTVATVGDSAALLDTGFSVLDLTESHRINDNEKELRRLQSAGCQLAPCGLYGMIAGPGDPGIGPRRVWPGGLACSRSIGDLDAAVDVIPIPHVKQVCLPSRGCRVILASDGLWDCLSKGDVIRVGRGQADPKGAAQSLLRRGSIQPLVNDDTTIVVIDAMPSVSDATTPGQLHRIPAVPTVPSPFTAASAARPQGSSPSGGAESHASASGQSISEVVLMQPSSSTDPDSPHLPSSLHPASRLGTPTLSLPLPAGSPNTTSSSSKRLSGEEAGESGRPSYPYPAHTKGINGTRGFGHLVAEAQLLAGGSGHGKSGSPSLLASILFGSCMDPSVVASRHLPPDSRDEPSGSPGHLVPVSDADGLHRHPSLLHRYIEATSRPGGFRSRNGSRESTVHSEMSALSALAAASKIGTPGADKGGEGGGGATGNQGGGVNGSGGARVVMLGNRASSSEGGIRAAGDPPEGTGEGGWRRTPPQGSQASNVPHVV